jgi:hypothetical protein
MLLIFSLSLLFVRTMAQASSSYVVQHKECLSQIAFQFCRKIYGKEGFIRQIEKLNPSLKRNPNLIKPNSVLIIPDIKFCRSKWPELKKEQFIPIALDPVAPIIHKTPDLKIDRGLEGGITFGYKILQSTSIIDSSSTSYKRIKGVSLNSKPIIGVGLKRNFEYSPQARHFIFGGLSFEDYYGSKKVNVSSSSTLRSHLGFGTDQQLTDGHQISFKLGVEERTFIDQSSFEEINITKALIPYAGAQHVYGLKEYLNHKFELHSRGRYLFSSESLGLKARPGYELGLGMCHKSLKAKSPSEWLLYISRLEQSTNVTHQTEWQFGVNWSVNLPSSEH